MAAAKTINQQLGEFLRQRREALSPEQLGLPPGRRRRTPGLRREEVAERCGISADWYTRLEQGRESLPSKATVESLAKGLRLSATERSHLLNLALGKSRRPFPRQKVPTHLVTLLESMQTAAYLLGVRRDILAWNRAAVALFRDFGTLPADKRNTLYLMFTSAAVRAHYPDWENEARGMLESFRITYDFWSHSPEFNELVERIAARSPEFRRWWNQHQVRKRPSGDKIMQHRTLGRIALAYATFQANDDPDLTLVVYGTPRRGEA